MQASASRLNLLASAKSINMPPQAVARIARRDNISPG
jgi:hypothetical protein